MIVWYSCCLFKVNAVPHHLSKLHHLQSCSEVKAQSQRLLKNRMQLHIYQAPRTEDNSKESFMIDSPESFWIYTNSLWLLPISVQACNFHREFHFVPPNIKMAQWNPYGHNSTLEHLLLERPVISETTHPTHKNSIIQRSFWPSKSFAFHCIYDCWIKSLLFSPCWKWDQLFC